MSQKEFGKVVEKSEGKSFKELGTSVKETPRWRSLVNAPIKGIIKGFADMGELAQQVPQIIPEKIRHFDPLGFIPGKKEKEKSPEELRQFSEEKFQTQEKGPESFLERAGSILPSALLGPGGLITKGSQVLGGATLGELAKAGGLPNWAQSIAEGLPFFYQGSKKIPLKASQKRIGEFLRNQGLSENEITPLLKTPEQIERWSKWASKGPKSRKLMESVYEKSGRMYDSIDKEASNLNGLTKNAHAELIDKITPIYKEMPSKYRGLIKQDWKDFLNSRGGLENLSNLYRDMNAVIGPEIGGRAIIGRFKEPLLKAMESINPKLAEDFALTTKLYATRAKVAGSILSRKQLDDFMDMGKAIGLGAAVFNRDMGAIGKLIGSAGARKFAREMLINPRLQNLSTRVGEALKKNKFTIVAKLMNDFNRELKKSEPELSESIHQELLDQKG